jgi:predicted porin
MKVFPYSPLLAVGCATLLGSTGAHAQSSVRISGLIDIGVYRDAGGTWNVGPIQRSNLAFTGSEELGGGTMATFALSTRFEPDTGTLEDPAAKKPFWHGESTLGLKGSLGSVQLGRRLDAMYNNDSIFDPWYNFDRVASPAWDVWHLLFPSDPQGNNGLPEYGRLNNGIFYDSPSVGGFALHVSGSPERRVGDSDRPLGASVTYNSGDLQGMVAHSRNSAGNTDTFAGLRGSVGPVTLMGAYDTSKAGSATSKAVTLGAEYAIGATTFKAGWGQADIDGTRAVRSSGLGAWYALSKRTTVYADYGHKAFRSGSANVYGMGIAHSF